MNPYQPGEDNQDPYEVGYKAGAASRDAEVAELKLRLEWNEDGWDGIACRNETIQMIEQDRHSLEQQLADREKQIVELRDAMLKAASEIRRCDYTPARSTLLTTLAATETKP